MIPYLLGNDFHRLAFIEYGDPAAPAVVCVHGLTRNGHDFDVLARALADRFHVICPDLPGRGASGWLPASALYQPASYVIALSHLLAYLDKPAAWVGTSLGGICGMMIAGAAHTPLTRLVLNDIGPHVPAASLARIRAYMQTAPKGFPTLDALASHLRLVHAPFGALTDAQWAHLAEHSARPLPEGGYALHYDPRITEQVQAAPPGDLDLGGIWQQIRVPVLAIRGAESDLLTEATFRRMQADKAAVYTVPDAGHAPALMDAPSIAVIRDFLEQS
jgi:pimeloyl-ACP methyl ester carboxylesterase